MAAIVGNKRKGMAARIRAIEVAAAITPTDRIGLEKRLDAAAVAGTVVEADNVKRGLHDRLTLLEDHVW